MKGTALTETNTAPRRSYRDERREDQRVTAQIRRDDQAARAKQSAADRKAALDRREARRKARTARRAARLASLHANAAELLLVPVILTGAALSWIGMAGYGVAGYGSVGIILPVLSEGGMWAFAEATTLTIRRHPGRPVWHLRAGTVVFAAVGAALNFLHGLPHGIGLGIAMAIISVSGVTAHQLITAGPRWSGAERGQARIERRVARRIGKAQRDAVDAAAVDLHAADGPRLVMPGELSPEPLVPAAAAPSVQVQAAPSNETTVAVRKAAFGTLKLTFTPAVPAPSIAPSNEEDKQVNGTSKGDSQTRPGPQNDQAPRPPKPPANPRRTGTKSAGRGGRKKSRAEVRAEVDQLVAQGGLSNPQIVERTGASLATVERRRAVARQADGHAVTSLADRRAAGQGR